MFNSLPAIQQAIADALQQAGISSLPNQYSAIAQRSQSLAYGYIVRKLAARGFLIAQITAWDDGANYELQIAVFFALQTGGVLANVSGAFLATFDLRKELDDTIVTIGGVFQDPLGTAGQVGVGDADHSQDIFTLPPSGTGDLWDDFPGPGRGERTRF